MLRLMRLTREERREERFGCTVVRPNTTKSPTNNECPSSVVCRISHILDHIHSALRPRWREEGARRDLAVSGTVKYLEVTCLWLFPGLSLFLYSRPYPLRAPSYILDHIHSALRPLWLWDRISLMKDVSGSRDQCRGSKWCA
jgi:hypothetical protein